MCFLFVVCFLFFGMDELTQEVAAHARAVGLARQDEPPHAFFQRHPHQAVRGAQAVYRADPITRSVGQLMMARRVVLGSVARAASGNRLASVPAELPRMIGDMEKRQRD